VNTPREERGGGEGMRAGKGEKAGLHRGLKFSKWKRGGQKG